MMPPGCSGGGGWVYRGVEPGRRMGTLRPTLSAEATKATWARRLQYSLLMETLYNLPPNCASPPPINPQNPDLEANAVTLRGHTRGVEGDEGVAGLVVRRQLADVLRHHPRLALRPHQHLVLCVLQMLLVHRGGLVPGREARGQNGPRLWSPCPFPDASTSGINQAFDRTVDWNESVKVHPIPNDAPAPVLFWTFEGGGNFG